MLNTSLQSAIVDTVKKSLVSLVAAGDFNEARRREIEAFLKSRFGDDCPRELVVDRLNDMIERFQELYVPLVSLDIKKYDQNA